MNACNDEMTEELLDCFEEIEKDRDAHSVIITGAGKAFCAGADLRARFLPKIEQRKQGFLKNTTREFSELGALALSRIRKVTIAAINGVATGVGCTLALGCDIRIKGGRLQEDRSEIRRKNVKIKKIFIAGAGFMGSGIAQVIKELTDKIGKIGVFVKDGPGFLVNRINAAMRNEVYNCLAEGVASVEDIDKAMKFGLGHPMGPLELQDFVGLEIGLAVMETLWENFKDPKWRPALSLRKLITSGDLGRKTGKGWYDYTSGEKKPRTDINL
jgi:hypothetical protein